MKRITILIVSMLMLSSIVIFIPEFPSVKGTDLTVSPGGGADHTAIQDAINASSDGDTIYVWAGSYNENISINKSLTIIGNGTANTTIDGTGISAGARQDATVWFDTINYVNLTGFTIRKNAGTYLIKFYNSENISIYGNNISDTSYGIQTSLIKNSLIYNNTFYNHSEYAIHHEGSGVNCTIYNNNFIDTNGILDIGDGVTYSNDYPFGGNYYDDYTGLDDGSGADNHSIQYDGISDTSTPYVYGTASDEYPWVQENGWLIGATFWVINLNRTSRFLTLQSAINDRDTATNHVLQAYNHTFNETSITIGKSVEIYGNSSTSTIINDTNVLITANNVKLHTLNFTGVQYAINVTGNNANLTDLNIWPSRTGINSSGDNIILQNIYMDNNFEFGMLIYGSTSINERNIILGGASSDGIVFNGAYTYVVRNATVTTGSPTTDIDINNANAIVVMINSTFDTTALISGSRLYRKYFFDVEVDDISGIYINATYLNDSADSRHATTSFGCPRAFNRGDTDV